MIVIHWNYLYKEFKDNFIWEWANKATQKPEEITEDEYSGYKFEQLFTTDQLNSTRFKETIILDKPQ